MGGSLRYCLTLNLRDDAELIAAYEEYHKPGNVWPEIVESIYAADVVDMEIFRHRTNLIMILEVNESFSFKKKALMDSTNPKVRAWERLMEKFQLVENEPNTDKWKRADRIFKLAEHRRVST